jgi:hypothetical protein
MFSKKACAEPDGPKKKGLDMSQPLNFIQKPSTVRDA